MNLFFRSFYCIAVFLAVAFQSGAQAQYVYHDATLFLKTGQAFRDAATYQRLPLRFKNNMRPYLWELSQRPAGMAIRFTTNSPTIAVRWKTNKSMYFPHVAESLIRGVDLYGKKNGKWFYAGLGKPSTNENHEAVVIKGMDSNMKEFLLHLPTYETVDSVFIGVAPGFVIQSPAKRGFRSRKPVVFYGTSIVQGASAMRPGMAYPSIISRNLNIEAINLGFSGNAHLDTIIARAMTEVDASCYVLDCGPNLTPAMVRERLRPFINILKQGRASVPVLLVGNIPYPHALFDKDVRQKIDSVNQIFQETFIQLKKEGVKELYYLPSKNLIGVDGEATVDGVHPTDLGFFRLAQGIGNLLRQILKLQ
ncbi:MAG TPA: SGNH/GDSL hydrolase family protein [Flavisolibacter sp.]|jgi:hypothetical protein|nr:SGNH/GDSL hydrolase family protein [Flavisolibacter sp.]